MRLMEGAGQPNSRLRPPHISHSNRQSAGQLLRWEVGGYSFWGWWDDTWQSRQFCIYQMKTMLHFEECTVVQCKCTLYSIYIQVVGVVVVVVWVLAVLFPHRRRLFWRIRPWNKTGFIIYTERFRLKPVRPRSDTPKKSPLDPCYCRS